MPKDAAAITCSFCQSDLGEVELMFKSNIGGLPPWICSDCVGGFADVLRLHRHDPREAAKAIKTHNARLGRKSE